MPGPKSKQPDAPKTDVRYVTLDGVRVARSATEKDARKHIEDMLAAPEEIARVRACHDMPPEGANVLDLEPGIDGEVY